MGILKSIFNSLNEIQQDIRTIRKLMELENYRKSMIIEKVNNENSKTKLL